jgi:septal ring factor EnvC (AmiA/AmiB activator)
VKHVSSEIAPGSVIRGARFARVVAAAWLISGVAFAQPSDRERTEALARRAGERLQALQREADRLASQEKTLLGELRTLEIQRQLKTEELRQIDTEVAAVGRDLAASTGQITSLEQRRAAAQPELRARVVEMYKLGQARYLRLLLSTSDVRRIGEASRTTAALAQLDQNRLASYQRTVDQLKTTRTTLDARRRRMDVLRRDALAAQAAADRAAHQRNDLVQDIDRRRDLNAQLSAELQAAQQKLQITLRSLTGGSGDTTANAVPTLPFKPFRGDLDWPTPGALRRPFARAGSASTTSNGIEIAAPEGAPVTSVHEGLVAYADAFIGFGNLVIVDHGSQAYSLYGNLLDIAVRKGARVERGQPLGTVGAPPTGAPGLYFELRVDGQPVDPLQWLKKK